MLVAEQILTIMAKANPITLDYGASVPETDGKPILRVNEPPPPDLPQFVDYVPSAGKIKNMAQFVKKAPSGPPDIAISGSDYVPSSIVEEVKKKRKEIIKNYAKKLYDEDKKRRDAWEAAQQIVTKMTVADKNMPTKEQEAAIKLLSSGTRPPLTVEQAVARAREQLNEEFKMEDIQTHLNGNGS